MADTHFYASKLDLVTKLTFYNKLCNKLSISLEEKNTLFKGKQHTKTKDEIHLSSVVDLLKCIYFSAM
jgi:hypothetical protein